MSANTAAEITNVRGVAVGAETSTDGAYIFVRPRSSILSLSWQY